MLWFHSHSLIITIHDHCRQYGHSGTNILPRTCFVWDFTEKPAFKHLFKTRGKICSVYVQAVHVQTWHKEMKFWSGGQFPERFTCSQCSINMLLLYCGSHGVQPVHLAKWQYPCWLWQDGTVLVNTDTIHPQIRMVNVEMMRQVSYGEVLGDKSIMNIRVTLYWGHLIVLWLFHLVCILYCGCLNLFCNVLLNVCWGVLVICVLVFTVFCIVCTVFVLFHLCIFILICCICTAVRTTATKWKRNRSNNNNNNNNNNIMSSFRKQEQSVKTIAWWH